MSGFLRWVEVDESAPATGYPFDLAAVCAVREASRWELDAAVTFLIGDNGSGKSTLVEAVAVAAGFNPEGGSANFRFTTRSSESSLGAHLRLVRGLRRPRTGYFLRAESFYNVATEIERLDEADPMRPLLPAYGGISPHERSHGESFLDLVVHRFGADGLYLLDEPEAALSVQGCLALLQRMADLVAAGSQFIVATHSPIVLAYPGAAIWQVSGQGMERVSYDVAEPVRLYRSFLADPGRYLRHLDLQ